MFDNLQDLEEHVTSYVTESLIKSLKLQLSLKTIANQVIKV
jgi:hypothetical protein